MKKKMLKERKPIEVIVKVETLKNGYSLDVDGKEYLYFDVVELAKGLILHAGLGRTSPTTKFLSTKSYRQRKCREKAAAGD